MNKKFLKITLLLFTVFLVGAGVFLARLEISDFFSGYFFNTWKESDIQTQTAPSLKLLTSHSHPEAGEKWVVSFETKGTADLTITPDDQASIDDLVFVSLACDGEEKTEDGPLQVLDGDVIFYSGWQCNGRAEAVHLVNIARKHILKFHFGDKAAFAYNNPYSVTDTFTDESKIASKENITVSGGQAYLSIACKGNGTVCGGAGECCSGNCVDGVCCDTACTGSTCQRCDSHSHLGAGTCGYVSNSSTDPDNECPGALGTCASTTCSGSGYSCGYLSGDQGCATCTYCTGASYSCSNRPNTYDCGLCVTCNGSGSCNYYGYYTAGTADNTAPSTCNATHYRCNGSGACTAPCSTNIACHWAVGTCNVTCITGGFCGCRNSCSTDYCWTGSPQLCTGACTNSWYNCVCYTWTY